MGGVRKGQGVALAAVLAAAAFLVVGLWTGTDWLWMTGLVLAIVLIGLFVVLPMVIIYSGSNWIERQDKGRAAAKRKRSREGRTGTCVVLDADAAVLYGGRARGGAWKWARPEVRRLLRDESVEKIVTPAAMRKVRRLHRRGLLDDAAMGRIEALADTGPRAGSRRIASAIESEQRLLLDSPDSDAAARWLAARRRRYRRAAEAGRGGPGGMDAGDRRRILAMLSDMASAGRLVMGEAAAVSRRHARTVLLSGNPDVVLFGDALKRAAGGGISVAAIRPAPRGGRGSGRGGDGGGEGAARAAPAPDDGGGPR